MRKSRGIIGLLLIAIVVPLIGAIIFWCWVPVSQYISLDPDPIHALESGRWLTEFFQILPLLYMSGLPASLATSTYLAIKLLRQKPIHLGYSYFISLIMALIFGSMAIIWLSYIGLIGVWLATTGTFFAMIPLVKKFFNLKKTSRYLLSAGPA